MPTIVLSKHKESQARGAWQDMAGSADTAHPVVMATIKRGPWRRTFLREWRESRGLSLESVAEKMGMNHGNLSKIERGLYPYTQRVLEIAAREYGCTIQDLLTRPPNDPNDIFGVYEKLSPAQRRQARRLLNALADEGEDYGGKS